MCASRIKIKVVYFVKVSNNYSDEVPVVINAFVSCKYVYNRKKWESICIFHKLDTFFFVSDYITKEIYND